MFFLLTLLVIISSYFLGEVYLNRQGRLLKKEQSRKMLIWGLWAIIIICTMFICANRATLGLVFNVHAPDTDFMQTINPDYMNLWVTDFIYLLIVGGVYYFVRKKVGIIQPVFLLLLMVATLAIYYPGIPSADGSNSYEQFQSHLYSDWQPPLFTIWWNIFRVQSATFIINIVTYYGGLIAISYYLLRKGKTWQNDLLVLFSLNPLVFTQLAIIWKDIGYTAFLIDCVAIYLFMPLVQSRRNKIILWGIYFICLFLAVGFRINGIFAAWPLAFAAIYKILADSDKLVGAPRLKRGLLAGGTSLLIMAVFLLANNFLTYKVFDAKRLYAPEFVMVSDMAYIECRTNHEFSLDSRYFISEDPEMHNVLCDQLANEYDFDAFFNNWNGEPSALKLVGDLAGYKSTQKAWLHTLAQYPGTYLVYRARFLTNVLFFQYWYSTNTGSPIADKLNAIAHYQHYDMKFILGLFLVSATIAIFALCLRFANYGIAFIIICSSILQMISWYFLIPAHAARYFLWNDIGAILAIALFSGGLARQALGQTSSKQKPAKQMVKGK